MLSLGDETASHTYTGSPIKAPLGQAIRAASLKASATKPSSGSLACRVLRAAASTSTLRAWDPWALP